MHHDLTSLKKQKMGERRRQRIEHSVPRQKRRSTILKKPLEKAPSPSSSSSANIVKKKSAPKVHVKVAEDTLPSAPESSTKRYHEPRLPAVPTFPKRKEKAKQRWRASFAAVSLTQQVQRLALGKQTRRNTAFPMTSLQQTETNTPEHIMLDPKTGYPYYFDPIANRTRWCEGKTLEILREQASTKTGMPTATEAPMTKTTADTASLSSSSSSEFTIYEDTTETNKMNLLGLLESDLLHPTDSSTAADLLLQNTTKTTKQA